MTRLSLPSALSIKYFSCLTSVCVCVCVSPQNYILDPSHRGSKITVNNQMEGIKFIFLKSPYRIYSLYQFSAKSDDFKIFDDVMPHPAPPLDHALKNIIFVISIPYLVSVQIFSLIGQF